MGNKNTIYSERPSGYYNIDNYIKFIFHVMNNKIQRDQVMLADAIFNSVTIIHIKE